MSTAQRFTSNRKQRVRTLWISDVHLGTRDCQAEHLAAFLKRYHADRIYLVGDIIDGWKLRGGIYWPRPCKNAANDDHQLPGIFSASRRPSEAQSGAI
ncbi:hypothetical protein ACG3RR_27645, partial [Pseudomonas aeruginosa]